MRTGELARAVGDVLVAWPRFLTAPLYRRRHLRWGATDAEVAATMPGDALIPTPSFTATRAITIAAPPDQVWPWIVQLGTGRAGWYGYDLLDNHARPSADRILPQFQTIRTGYWVPMSSTVNETTAFSVKALEVNRWLLWAKRDSSWAWQLTPIDGGHTRLVTRLPENATMECQGGLLGHRVLDGSRSPQRRPARSGPANGSAGPPGPPPPSGAQLVPDLQRPLRVGDHIPDGPPGTAWFAVDRVDPPTLLVLHSTTHLPASWQARLGEAIDWSWTFTLADTGDGGTRLLLRVRGSTRPWWLTAVYVATLVPADYVMASGMLAGIRRRAAPTGQHLGPGRIADERGGQPA